MKNILTTYVCDKCGVAENVPGTEKPLREWTFIDACNLDGKLLFSYWLCPPCLTKVAQQFPWEDKMTKCPRCNENELHEDEARNALSRKDNKTYVCSACGTDEAIFTWRGLDVWASFPEPLTTYLNASNAVALAEEILGKDV